ncbi:uncharacterized protein LOC113328440 [Papaver somniferum]|uniref:uncharacterized protein LOC113328440 n=1 Tax=Papaver somniferum TaxID=3469 RepID=UPI000E6F8294|nr:uncharacterized protein LOC113328440 [Papaver somniferum]
MLLLNIARSFSTPDPRFVTQWKIFFSITLFLLAILVNSESTIDQHLPQRKILPTFNVLNFGAVGDGIHDDTRASGNKYVHELVKLIEIMTPQNKAGTTTVIARTGAKIQTRIFQEP